MNIIRTTYGTNEYIQELFEEWQTDNGANGTDAATTRLLYSAFTTGIRVGATSFTIIRKSSLDGYIKNEEQERKEKNLCAKQSQ